MTCRVIVEPKGGAGHAFDAPRDGRSLADTLANYGFPLNTRCGQRGLCRGCAVQVREGTVCSADGTQFAASATVRASQMRLAGPVSVHIQTRSRIYHRPPV